MILKYSAYSEIKLPTEHAEKLESGDWKYSIKWGELTYTDDEGNEHTVEADEPETHCKFPEEETFEHPTEYVTKALDYHHNPKTHPWRLTMTDEEKKEDDEYIIAMTEMMMNGPKIIVSEKKISETISEDAICDPQESKDGLVQCQEC